MESTANQPRVIWDQQHAQLSLPDGLLVDFKRVGDRWSHQVYFCEADQRQQGSALLGSIEGDAQQSWPPSPPLQSLDCTYINDSPVLFAVGQAGQGHWSASVSLHSLENGQGSIRANSVSNELDCSSQSNRSQHVGFPSPAQPVKHWAIEFEIAWFGRQEAIANDPETDSNACQDRTADRSHRIDFRSSYEVCRLEESSRWQLLEESSCHDSESVRVLRNLDTQLELVVEPFEDSERMTAFSGDPRQIVLSPAYLPSSTVDPTKQIQTNRQIRWGYRLYLRKQ